MKTIVITGSNGLVITEARKDPGYSPGNVEERIQFVDGQMQTC